VDLVNNKDVNSIFKENNSGINIKLNTFAKIKTGTNKGALGVIT
jgi:hypothetical protein